jgi:hypothetical protein
MRCVIGKRFGKKECGGTNDNMQAKFGFNFAIAIQLNSLITGVIRLYDV